DEAIVVVPIDDQLVEGSESVVLELTVPAVGPGELPPYAISAPGKAEVTIADNDVANAAPTVVMVAPADGSKFSAAATVLLKARAEDSDGTVSGVVFYRGDTVIGPGVADSSDPKLFTREWPDVAAGSYALTAVATDNNGATKRSAPVLIEVVTLPVVTIAVADGTAREGTPATDTATLVVSRTGDKSAGLVVHYQLSGTATAGSDYVALSGTVEIPVGQADEGIVVVPIDDQLIEGSESVVLELTVPAVGPGELPPYAIGVPGKAEVTIADNDGGSLDSTVVMLAPADGSKFSAPATVLLKARAEDSDGTVSGVVFYRGDTVIGPGVADSSDPKLFTREWPDVAAGSYALTALATDNNGATKR